MSKMKIKKDERCNTIASGVQNRAILRTDIRPVTSARPDPTKRRPGSLSRSVLGYVVLLLSALSSQLSASAGTVTGYVHQITMRASTNEAITFTPYADVLISASGLSGGPAVTIRATNGGFSQELDAGRYYTRLPLVPGRLAFVIDVPSGTDTNNITNLIARPWTYQQFAATMENMDAALTNTSARRIFVRTNGNDTTAVKYSLGLAHQTLVAANIAAVPGDVVDVGPGLFSGVITNKSGVQYHFGAATIWSNGTPNTLIHMATGGTVDFSGRGKWVSDTIFSTAPYGVSNILGKIEAAEIHPVTSPETGYTMLLQDGFDTTSEFVTNGAGTIDLKIVADVAELAFYSHIFSASPLNRSVATNATFNFDVGRLKLYAGDEAMTNWCFNISPRDYVDMNVSGGSARFIVNGGRLIATNPWSHDVAGFAANSLVMNNTILTGTNLPPPDYYHGMWRTNDTNVIVKAGQFVGNQYGALHFLNAGSPQTVLAGGAAAPMVNYSRTITNGTFSNKASGLLTNRNAGTFQLSFTATATATLLPASFTIYTNNVATDAGGVISPFGGDVATSGAGIFDLPAMTQIKLMINGDDVTVTAAALLMQRLQ